jgi:hypothetical protein
MPSYMPQCQYIDSKIYTGNAGGDFPHKQFLYWGICNNNKPIVYLDWSSFMSNELRL